MTKVIKTDTIKHFKVNNLISLFLFVKAFFGHEGVKDIFVVKCHLEVVSHFVDVVPFGGGCVVSSIDFGFRVDVNVVNN